MPDKISDNEIIKALECHLGKHQYTLRCPHCPYRQYACDCLPKLHTDLLNLINRLQADNDEKQQIIDHLEAENYVLMEDKEKLQAENERLKEEVAKEFTCFVGDPHKVEHCPYLEQVKTAKAEAYKEFAQKLESIIMWSPKNHISITTRDVREILEGLAGEQPTPNNVKCIDCEYLEFKTPYGICSEGYMGIVYPEDSCGKGKLKEKVGEDNEGTN